MHVTACFIFSDIILVETIRTVSMASAVAVLGNSSLTCRVSFLIRKGSSIGWSDLIICLI